MKSVRYSVSFQQKVVLELESGRWSSHNEARQYYGITGCDTLPRWVRRHGKEGLHERRIVVMSVEEESELLRLRREVSLLRQDLRQAQVNQVISDSYLTIACREFGIDDVEQFKKNTEGRRSVKGRPTDPTA